MVKGFVFGKFMPFHKGHQAMIKFAATHCDMLTVLVCCSDKETIPDTVRAAWITETFRHNSHINVVVYNYSETVLPNTSTASMSVSELWANVFTDLLPGHTLLCTSEPYGPMVAGFMGIQHLPFDDERKLFPVSASSIRTNLFANWHYLPDSVKPYYATKVVVAGTESTGKTTLSEHLAAHYNCSLVSEAGRDIIPDSTEFANDDLYLVAAEHARRIDLATRGGSPLIIIDTDIHITMSYSRFMFGTDIVISEDIYNTNKADLYLFLNNDVAYVQDGTRLEQDERDALDINHRQVFEDYEVKLIEIRGNWEERLAQAVACIDNIIARKY